MRRVFRTRQAEEDLLGIWQTIAEDNAIAADEFLDKVDEKCKDLLVYPDRGQSRDNLAPRVRSVLCGSYLVFYRPAEDGIVIIRVLHGARDMEHLL